MKILLLSPPRPNLVNFLESHGDEVILTEAPLIADSEMLNQIEFIISYGYRHILREPILSQFSRRIINLHISLLPWNRGADPNLWSFLEDTPKGVTIHLIDAGIDTGDILVQKEVTFSKHETLRTSYEKLSQVALDLFQSSWLEIRDGWLEPIPQPHEGTFHRLRDRQTYEHLLTQGWDTPVDKLIGKALPNHPVHV